nr:S8 family serine peptidase [Geitlerinema sp. P-1104]
MAPGEGSEHGTHLLGLIAAQQDNGIGIDGINPEAPVWLGRGVGSGEWASSLVEFVDAAAESGQTNAVVNLSLDLTEMDAEGNVSPRYELTVAERTAIEYARQQGVLLVVAAGNDGGNLSALAQASREFDNVLTVGAAEAFDPNLAVAQGHGRAEYSNFGTGLGLLAPGGTAENPVLSTVGDDLGTLAGTSVATARVTGATSVVWAANPELSYRQVIEILQTTATDLGTPNWNPDTGAGLLNLLAAVHLAKATKPQAYDPTPIEIGETPRRRHLVRPGETPAGLAEEELGDEEAWVEITDSEGNPFESPDEPLVPGTEVELPMYGGGVVNPQVESPAREPQPLTPANQAPEDLRLALNRLYNPGETIRIPGRVLDEDGAKDIERVEFWLKSGDGDWVPYPELVHFSEDRRNDQVARFEYELEGLEPGKYQLKATAYDSEGQTAEFESQWLTVLSVDEGQGLSPILKTAIEQSMDLDGYDPERLAETRQWVVSIQAGTSAGEIAEELGADFLGATGQIPNTYIFEFPEGRDPHEVAQQLQGVQDIEFAYPSVPVSLSLWSDPRDNRLFDRQWNLENTEVPGQDINFLKAWDDFSDWIITEDESGYNVVIGIVDDGVDYEHPDLVGRYRADLSQDFTPTSSDYADINYAQSPSPRASNFFDVNFSNYEVTQDGIRFILPVSLTGAVTNTKTKVEMNQPLPEGLVLRLHHDEMANYDPKKRQRTQRYRRFPGSDDLESSNRFATVPQASESNTLFSLETPRFDTRYSGGNWVLEIKHSDSNSEKNTEEFFEQLHQDIIDDLSWELELSTANLHGTAVAGVALSSNNGRGIIGVDPHAEFASLKLIGDTSKIANQTSGEVISSALFMEDRNHEIDIFNNSWGPGYLASLPRVITALQNGVTLGRNQFGNLYVVAAGNDGYGKYSGNVNYNRLANSRHTIAVGALDRFGQKTSYSTPGSSLFISTYSSHDIKTDEGKEFQGIPTTDVIVNHDEFSDEYNFNFGGTSASAAVISGAISWLLKVNPELTYRDIQYILAETAIKNDPDDDDWVQNGGGYWVNHKYGFGSLDLHAAVSLATTWETRGTEADLMADSLVGQYRSTLLDLEIPDNDRHGVEDWIEVDEDRTLEWVEVTVDINHSYRGDLELVLVSPDGTESVLARPHVSQDSSKAGADYNWTFTTARHWGESSEGEWTLRVIDKYSESDKNDTGGILNSWSLDLYGTKPYDELDYPQPGYVNHKIGNLPLNLRQGPSMEDNVPDVLQEGTTLTIVETVTGGSYPTPDGDIRSDWYKIEVGGQIGYVAAYFVNKGKPDDDPDEAPPDEAPPDEAPPVETQPSSGPLDFTVIHQGRHGSHGEYIEKVITDESEWQDAWEEKLGTLGELDVDFEKYSLIVVGIPGSDTSHKLEIDEIQRQDGNIVVDYTHRIDSFGFAVVTNPYKVIQIERTTDPVIFNRDVSGPINFEESPEMSLILWRWRHFDWEQYSTSSSDELMSLSGNNLGHLHATTREWIIDRNNNVDLPDGDVLVPIAKFNGRYYRLSREIIRDDLAAIAQETLGDTSEEAQNFILEMNQNLMPGFHDDGLTLGTLGLIPYEVSESELNLYPASSEDTSGDSDEGDNTSSSPPSIPTNLRSEQKGNDVTLSWDVVVDGEISQEDLTYNLRVGTTPGGSDIVDATQEEAEISNVDGNMSWTLEDVEPGAYYWTVQTVNNEFITSDFAPQESFFHAWSLWDSKTQSDHDVIRTYKITESGTMKRDHYYAFTLDDYHQVDIGLTELNQKAGFEIIKISSEDGSIEDGEIIAESMSMNGLSASPRLRNLEPGEYYIRIFPDSETVGEVDYTLQYQATPSDIDGNGTLPTADNLFSGVSIMFGDFEVTSVHGSLGNGDLLDFWRLDISETQDIKLELKDLSADVSVALIQDINGNGKVDPEDIIASTEFGQSELLLEQRLQEGEYFVRVKSKNPDNLTSYELKQTSYFL